LESPGCGLNASANLTFQFKGEVAGVNGFALEGLASMARDANL
jgi:hypothetical protein